MKRVTTLHSWSLIWRRILSGCKSCFIKFSSRKEYPCQKLRRPLAKLVLSQGFHKIANNICLVICLVKVCFCTATFPLIIQPDESGSTKTLAQILEADIFFLAIFLARKLLEFFTFHKYYMRTPFALHVGVFLLISIILTIMNLAELMKSHTPIGISYFFFDHSASDSLVTPA